MEHVAGFLMLEAVRMDFVHHQPEAQHPNSSAMGRRFTMRRAISFHLCALHDALSHRAAALLFDSNQRRERWPRSGRSRRGGRNTLLINAEFWFELV
jgi:hypothetical protein